MRPQKRALSPINGGRGMKIFLGIMGLFLALSHTTFTEAGTLPDGFGKTTWGMSFEEVISVYQVKLLPPKSADPGGIWAIRGPAPGELTVSGEALGEPEVRSVSFGIHQKWGLVIVHVRFKNTNDPSHVEKLLPKWTAEYGPPKEKRPGPKVIWEDTETHVELTYHTVSLRHPTPSDHLAIVLWNIPMMDKLDAQETGGRHTPDVEKLEPMKELHKKK